MVGLPYNLQTRCILGFLGQELKKILRNKVQRHLHSFVNQRIDKTTIPLYQFLSDAGTGKSRYVTELLETIYKCFDGIYFDKNEKQISCI